MSQKETINMVHAQMLNALVYAFLSLFIFLIFNECGYDRCRSVFLCGSAPLAHIPSAAKNLRIAFAI